jgi:hypothetical protein
MKGPHTQQIMLENTSFDQTVRSFDSNDLLVIVMYEYTLETEEMPRTIDFSKQGVDRDTQETDVE